MAGDARTVQDRRRELLARRLAEQGLTGPAAPAAAPAPQPGQRYPLTAGQRRMWFRQHLDPADTTLTIGVGYRLRGEVDPARLRAAFDAVLAGHTVLRTRYGVDDTGEPYQVFDDAIALVFTERDADAAAVDALIAAEFATPFDLTAAPPLRVLLLRTAPAEWILVLTVHHICWDDDCWAVLFADLNRAYAGTPPNAAVPQYISVQPVADPDPADLAYWCAALTPLPEPVTLPGPGGGGPQRAAAHHRGVPAELFERVEAFARTHATTPFAVLLAAYGALIGRYTDTGEPLVAVPVTDRPAGADGALGYFGNTVLLRLNTDPDTGFAAAVEAVRETSLTGFSHAGAGIDAVISALNPTRAAGRDGLDDLVRLGFSLRKDAAGLVLAGVDVEQLPLVPARTPVPLTLAVVTDARGVTVELEYQADVLDAALIERLAGHYLRLLDAGLAEPDRPLGLLELLDGAERAAITAAATGPVAEAAGGTLVEVLETAAAARPQAIAVVGDDAELSHADLHARANRLARRLIGGLAVARGRTHPAEPTRPSQRLRALPFGAADESRGGHPIGARDTLCPQINARF